MQEPSAFWNTFRRQISKATVLTAPLTQLTCRVWKKAFRGWSISNFRYQIPGLDLGPEVAYAGALCLLEQVSTPDQQGHSADRSFNTEKL
ncbi:hypothetical protein TY91_09195 [Secundilactobacillus collinoides]|uniref:Uncharacterized protein n=1 Tax=Secundilactobacillus collinoides TaxID=33960 RepID=A0A161VHN1_SECCO|nr:hypothetical protein TY91_09195 [Secundilactobacillus collinoides]